MSYCKVLVHKPSHLSPIDQQWLELAVPTHELVCDLARRLDVTHLDGRVDGGT